MLSATITSLLAALAQTSDGSPFPTLTMGAVVAIGGFAVSYGVSKGKGESSTDELKRFRESSTKEIVELREEVQQGFRDVNTKFENINRSLGRIEGRQGRKDKHDE